MRTRPFPWQAQNMTENENVSSFCCESCRKKKKRVQWHRNERKRWQGEEDDAEHVQKILYLFFIVVGLTFVVFNYIY